MATGIKTTTTGVLFIKPEATSVAMRNAAVPAIGRFLAAATTRFASASRSPVRTKAPLITNIAAIVRGAGLANAARTSFVGTNPKIINNAAAPAAVTSGSKRSEINAANKRRTIASAM